MSPKTYNNPLRAFSKTLRTLCALCILCALCASCKDDNGSNPTLGEPSTFVLNTPAYSTVPVDLATSTEIPFSWSSPDYGFPVAAQYQLEASIDGSFSISTAEAEADESGATIPNYVVLPATFFGGHGTIACSTLAQALNLMGNWGEGETPATQSLVVRASATAGSQKIYSNTVNIVVIPTAEVAPAWPMYIYEIGNESGWSTAHALACPAQDGVFSGYYWLDGGFKFKPNPDNWDGDWGQDPAGEYGTLVVDGEEDCNDPNKSFPDQAQPAGFYKVTVDLTVLTWKMEPINSISIIGAFNDWAGDVEMTYNIEGGYWEVTTDAVSGEYKFRANHDWAINWGGTEENLVQDGANLSSEGGTHTYKLYITYDGDHHVVIE